MFSIDVGADAGLLRLKGHKKSLKKTLAIWKIYTKNNGPEKFVVMRKAWGKNTGHMKNLKRIHGVKNLPWEKPEKSKKNKGPKNWPWKKPEKSIKKQRAWTNWPWRKACEKALTMRKAWGENTG